MVLFLSLNGSAQAHEQSQTPSNNYIHNATAALVKKGCNNLHITLRGNTNDAAPIIECSDALSSGGVSPNIGVVDCSSSSIILYWDEYAGGTLCFSGTGATDLTSYCAPWNYGGCVNNWNDKVTSFTSYANGKLYRDIGEQNYLYSLSNGSRADFAGNNSLNDQASSICLGYCP